MADAVRLMGRTSGVFAAPEGGATAAGLAALLEAGRVARDAEIVLFNTGSGLKYL
jgi:threonine synthase